jgi:hypothetical protein
VKNTYHALLMLITGAAKKELATQVRYRIVIRAITSRLLSPFRGHRDQKIVPRIRTVEVLQDTVYGRAAE